MLLSNSRELSLRLVRCCLQCQRNFLSSSAAFSTQTANPDVPVIRVPKRLEIQLEKLRKKKGPIQWQNKIFTARPGKEIISAKRKEYSYYQNQATDKFKPPKFASHGWKHRRSHGDYFTIRPLRQNPSVLRDSQAVIKQNFSSFKLSETLLNNLAFMQITNPTVVQQLAIPEVMSGGNILFAAETGSGKTLAYLLPIIHSLMKLKSTMGISTVPKKPRCVILVPAQELAEQVMGVADKLLINTGLTARYLDGKKRVGTYRATFEEPVDIVITTSGPLLASLRYNFVSLDLVRHFVVDEADTLLDDSFQNGTLVILGRLQVIASSVSSDNPGLGTQLTLVSATMPKRTTEILQNVLPEDSLKVVSTPYLHRLMPHVSQKFMRIKSSDKAVTLVEIVKRDYKRFIPTLIFCNQVSTCNWLSLFLNENGIPSQRLNSGMKPDERYGILESFQEGRTNVLVCTDIASRGVDTIRAEHVINFDFPNFMSDYIHRTGRVGRVGSKGSGHVTSFVVHKWDVDLVHKIEGAIRERSDLPRVDANIKRKHTLRNTQQDFGSLMMGMQ